MRLKPVILCLLLTLTLAAAPYATAGTVGCCTSGQYSFSADLSNTGFLLPAGTVTVVQATKKALTVTIVLDKQSGLQFNFRNNGQGTVSFNLPAGSTITLPNGGPWAVASTNHSLNLPSGLNMNSGLVLTGNNNRSPITSVTFTVSNANGISISDFVAANFNGTSIYFGAHVWGPLTNGTTNSGWVGATCIPVPEPGISLMLVSGLLAGLVVSRKLDFV